MPRKSLFREILEGEEAGTVWTRLRDRLRIPWWFTFWPRAACAQCGAGFWRSWPWSLWEEFCSKNCSDLHMAAVDEKYRDQPLPEHRKPQLTVLLRNWDATPVATGDADTQFMQPVTVVADVRGVEIRAEGYGELGAAPGYGSVLFLELDAEELVLRVWADINQEDPTHTIRLGGARESERKPDGG